MSAPIPDSKRFPSQVKFIVGNEACERFSYYGMRSILAGYITGEVLKGGLGQNTDTSTEIIHLFVSANYFMPLIGAWLSDKIIGRYHTILWVSLLYCAGHGVLACSDFAPGVHGKLLCLYTGLALIALGSGGIKPCVSAFMGDQFKPDQSHLLQKAYGAFYWAINFGSFFSFLLIPWIKDSCGYSLAFGVPGILMGVATFVFWLGTKHYVRMPTNRELHHAGFFKVFWHAYRSGREFSFLALLNIFTTLGLPILAIAIMTYLGFSKRTGETAQVLGWSAIGCVGLWYLLVLILSLLRKTSLPPAFWQKASPRHDNKEITGASSLSPILFIFAFVPMFWSLFDQTNSTWVIQGGHMTPALVAGSYLFGLLLALSLALLVTAIRSGDETIRLINLAVAGAISLSSVVYMLHLLSNLARAGSEQGGSVFLPILIFGLSLGWLAISIWGRLVWIRLLLCALCIAAFSVLLKYRQEILPLHFKIGAEEMQSMNPAIVMVLVPLFTLWIYPRIGRFASPLRRMSYGMFLASASYLVVAALQKQIEGGAQICVLWQTVPYIILTAAEVLISTTGLEFAFREAAAELKSTIMSFWLLTVTMGGLFVVTITKLFAVDGDHAASVSTGRFLQYAGLSFVVAILFSTVAAFYRYRDTEAAQGR